MIRNRLNTLVACAGMLAMTSISLGAAGREQGQGRGNGQYRRQLAPTMTGTYQLDPARSDDPQRVADVAIGRLGPGQRTGVRRQIQNRLDPPDYLAIERVGSRVTIASSKAPQMAFDADGRARIENTGTGRNTTTRATTVGDRIEVTSTGAQGLGFVAIFEPLANGDLRVTRRLIDNSLRQPLEVRSVYRRTSSNPDWNLYTTRNENGNQYGAQDRNPNYDPNYQDRRRLVVPSGMALVATLNQSVGVSSVRQNDPVTLTVLNSTRPELDGATIDGYIVTAPNRVSNRTGVTFEFNQIRLRDGRTADFDGTVESVRGPNGEAISFDGESLNEDNSPDRDEAIKRGAIGAALGALIGAVAGGGKGAAIGAVLGGGGAAATVFIGGNGSNSLPRGTEFTLRAR